MNNTITLTESHQINYNHKYFKELDNLCFLSKNLYNATLFAVRQHYIKEKQYLSYYKVNKIFTKEKQSDYIALPAKVSKHTQMLVHRAFKSFFALLKKSDKDKKVRLPKYLNKNGRQVVHYEKGALSFKKEGFIKLSKTDVFIKTNLTKDEVQFVRVVPVGNHIKVEVGYNKEIVNQKEEHKNILAIDLGLNNLMTVVSNVANPLIINGRPLKSFNHYYNKKKAQLQSILEQRNNTKTSKQLDIITRKRNNKVNDYIHKSINILMNYIVSNKIDLVIIGYSSGMKQNINLGKRNNQNFTNIPFLKIIQTIEYKCALIGVAVQIQEESYTSKASFFDDDDIPVFDKNNNTNYVFSGKRIKRGLYKTSNKTLVNADVNGALNIFKKYVIKYNKVSWKSHLRDDLVLVCSLPCIQAKTPTFN